jgi:hypothetical protein
VDDATNRANNKEYFANEAQKWLSDVNEEVTRKLEEEEANFTTQQCGKSEELKVRHKVPEVGNNSTYSFNLLLSEEEQSKAMVAILKLLSAAQFSDREVIELMPENPDRALWLGIKLLNKSRSAIIRDVLDCGTGGKKFQRGKACYQTLKNKFGDYKY